MASDLLSTTFSALADPTRCAILERLSDGAMSVGQLAEPFEMTLPGISKHLKVLECAGLICAPEMPSGGRANCRPSRSKTPLPGSSTIGDSGKGAWTG